MLSKQKAALLLLCREALGRLPLGVEAKIVEALLVLCLACP